MEDKLFRIEHDSMGEVAVPADKYWGAQTQRSLENFRIGDKTMPSALIEAFGYLKKAAALANRDLCPNRMTEERCAAITAACDEICAGELADQFPLVVYQTGSGTQTNMNVNEVVANRANVIAHRGNGSPADIPTAPRLCHPNDHVNMSQSSNDTFPSAMHIAAKRAIRTCLLPSLDGLIAAFCELEAAYGDIVKCGRTHLQDATPIRFGQEIAGWRGMLEVNRSQILTAMEGLSHLALGGTAVGTGLNAPVGFDVLVAEKLTILTGETFCTDPNKFHALTAKDELTFAHGALKALAANLMKIANDIRWLASGPRLGLGEITIPENEPGSSIMPGKVNPTQCEAITMVAVRVMANDVAVGLAASQGNFQLNVYMPVLAAAFLESTRLLGDAMASFCANCVSGIRPVRPRMEENLHRSLMTVTALTPYIGYENAARVAHLAHEESITLREATLRLGYMDADRFDEVYHPEKMV
ncbi:MAG: class II fumarate hydratase [Clostridia bacterium]|nr:class II fumarate hydratase [Clostridia bacterium]